MNKIVLIGCGNVGMSYAYALCTKDLNVDELVLVDINKQKAEGEALDLSHAKAYLNKPMKIKAGDYADCNDAKIVCICAGRNQEVGETRQDLIHKNYGVFKSIISEVNKTNFNGVYLVATNPLDTMTYLTQKLSGFNPSKVIGSGTTLDTARLRYIVADKLSINTQNVHAYVIGEHGDSEFVAWKNALIGPNKASKYLTSKQMSEIQTDVRNSAYEIINKKGNTAYGIGVCLEGITRSILNNERKIFTVSCYDMNKGLYYGMPAIVGENGVVKVLGIDLSSEEKKELENSIKSIKLNIKSMM